MSWRRERREIRPSTIYAMFTEIMQMGEKTDAAVQDLLTEVQDSKTKLAGYKAWMEGEPERTAAAVADALTAAGVDDAAQADLISQSRQDISDAVDDAGTAIHTAPGGGEAPDTEPPPGVPGTGGDTVSATLEPNEATLGDGVQPAATPDTGVIPSSDTGSTPAPATVGAPELTNPAEPEQDPNA